MDIINNNQIKNKEIQLDKENNKTNQVYNLEFANTIRNHPFTSDLGRQFNSNTGRTENNLNEYSNYDLGRNNNKQFQSNHMDYGKLITKPSENRNLELNRDKKDNIES